MKHVPGKPLIGSPEHAAAMAKPKDQANAWMQQKHQQLADTVSKLHKDTGLLHADLKNGKSHLAYLRSFY
jgi:serine/threonine-protein kinase RIO1